MAAGCMVKRGRRKGAGGRAIRSAADVASVTARAGDVAEASLSAMVMAGWQAAVPRVGRPRFEGVATFIT